MRPDLSSIFILLLVGLSKINGEGRNAELHIDTLFQEFVAVSNFKEVVLFLQAKIVEENPDMMRVVNYLNGTDFKAINDHMWKHPEFTEVRYDL
jgi:ferritin